MADEGTRGDGAYDDFDDSSTASYRAEQGKPERRTVNERMRNVPISFGGDGSGGIVGRGPEPLSDERGPNPEAAENQRAVEEGAKRLEREKGE
ncbi:MAG TPA: hypothetical protein VGE02_17380 [Gemmatimonadales bacterium]